MVDWHSSMQQTFEYYKVDPTTWADKERMDNILSGSIERNNDSETKGSASFDTTSAFDECYVRPYLITIQNGIRDRHPLGTYLCQTPNDKYDGKVHSISIDAYTPLIELKEKGPPIGYSILRGRNIMGTASTLTRENLRAPVVPVSGTTNLPVDFVANLDDTWLTFLQDFIASDKYSFGLDEYGRIIFEPQQDFNSMQPVWTYEDNEISILYPELSLSRDLYNVPNVVEVVYSSGAGYMYSKVVNNSPNSPISTVNRGREVIYRDSNPSISGNPTQFQLDLYAKQLLRNLSSLEYTLTYSHGYCPVRVGDCVRINYKRQNLNNVKARVISQSIKCATGCTVEETAVYTENLWE